MFNVYSALRSPNRIRVANRSESSAYRGSVASTERANTPLVSQNAIKIVNPPDTRRVSVSPDHCQRWIRRGLASWVVPGAMIRLSNGLRKRMMGVVGAGPAVPGGGYDSIQRQMRSHERRHIPLSEPPPRPTKRKIVVAHSGPAGRVFTFTEAELAERAAAPYPPPYQGTSWTV